MDFSQVYKQSLSKFSPNGEFIATAVQQRLVIRQTDTLQILQLYTCLDNIQDLQWSPDSDLILCVSYKLKTFQIWCLSNEKWTAQIDEGLAGLVKVMWTPDGRHLMSFSDFNVDQFNQAAHHYLGFVHQRRDIYTVSKIYRSGLCFPI
jgi:hypothetical protein